MVYTFILYTGLSWLTVSLGNKIIKREKNRYKTIKVILLCVLLGVFAALRGETGTDSVSYRAIYENPAMYFERYDVEIGYKILMYICNSLGFTYKGLFFLMNFFTSICCLYAINDERDFLNVKIALWVFMFDFYFFSFNIMRQSLSISLCLLGFTKWLNNDKKKAIFLFLLAIAFHRASVICLIVIFSKVLIDSKKYKELLAVATIFALSIVINREWMLKLVEIFTNGNNHYMVFLSAKLATSGDIFGYIIKIAPLLLVCFMSLYRTENAKNMRIYFALMIAGYVLSLMGEFTASEVERIGFYFSYCRIFMAGFATNGDLKLGLWSFKKTQMELVVWIYLLIVYIYNIYFMGGGELVPYLYS